LSRFNIRQVEAFRAVVTLGSMTKAADLLGISQPAVSRLVVDFEDAVGFKLFRRQRGGVEPTEDARALFVQVEKLFVGLEELDHHVHAIRSLGAGTVSIVAMGIYANGLVPELIGAFRRSYPDIIIKLESQPHDRIVDWVSSRRSDIGFTTLPVAGAAAASRELLRESALCVMPAGHPLAGKAAISARDLAGLPFVSFPRGTPFRFETDALFARENVERQLLTEAGTHEAVCALVAAGLGLSVVSPFSPHLRGNSQLVFRPFRPAIPVIFGMISEEQDLSAAARALHDFALVHFGETLNRTGQRASPASSPAAPRGGSTRTTTSVS
jgi:DNA-binding transcriptional LysR family regulator